MSHCVKCQDQCKTAMKDVITSCFTVQELEALIETKTSQNSPENEVEEVIEDKNYTKIKGVFEGSVHKAESNLTLPTKVQINWFNSFENPKDRSPDSYNGEQWRMLTTSTITTDSSFKLELETTTEEMNQNITLYSRIKNALIDGNVEVAEKLENFRFAMGVITGHYDEEQPQKNIYNSNLWKNLVQGPHQEMAFADIYVVFYKHDYGSSPFKHFGFPDCNWFNQLPEGFSCGKGSNTDPECNRNGRKTDGFVQVPCNEIVLKISKERCEKSSRLVDNWDRPDCLLAFDWA